MLITSMEIGFNPHTNNTVYTLKMCSLLKFENNSSSINFTYFREKTYFLALELSFISSSWRVRMHTKFDIKTEKLEWNKKPSIFAKWTI